MQLTNRQALPPGLYDLAMAENLSDARVRQLAAAWDTIRGHRPRNLAEWREFYNAVKQFFTEGDE